MCRNIRVLHHFQPPTTPEEIHAAALQYVRKVSGLRAPAREDHAAFDQAVAHVVKATTDLLATLPKRTEPKTRESEREKAKAKWTKRVARTPGLAGA